MYVFSDPKGEKYNSLITEYEQYLPEYFRKLSDLIEVHSDLKSNPEYLAYRQYHKWPIRKLEYSFVIKEMKKFIFEEAKVLDAGCGVSPMPFLWAKLGGDITAVDFDEENIRLMQWMSDNDFFGVKKSINIELCDIMTLPYENNTFDIVTSISVIEHLPYPNYLLALSELYRILKPGGVLICTCDIKTESDSKKNAIGAFSTKDIVDILNVFQDELLEDSKNYKNLYVSKNEIERFWDSHYYEGIGYEGNREYVAIGFSLKKNGTEEKKEKLLPYDRAVEELITYQSKIEDLQFHIEEKNQRIIEIEAHANQRLDDVCKLTSMYKEIYDEAEKRLKDIIILTDIINQKEKEIINITENNTQLLNLVQNVTQEVEKLSDENEQLSVIINSLNAKVHELTTENNELKNRIQELLSENCELNSRLQNMTIAKNDLNIKLQSLLAQKSVRLLRKVRLLQWKEDE